MSESGGTGQRRFEGKVVFITGGARGQGRSHAVALGREGASVALLDIASGEIGHPPYRVASRDDLEQTAKLVEQAGGQALPLVADVREEDQVEAAVAEAVEAFGGIDHLISNAGALAKFQQSWTIPKVDWDASIATNLTGHWLTCRHVIPRMIERTGNRGIILVSSGAGIQALPYASDYCAAKYGVVGLGKTLANELGPYRIRVNVLVPGAQDTPMIDSCAEANGFTRDQMLGQFKNADLLGAGAMRPEEATTPAVLWLLSDEAKWVNGSVQVVDAGLDAKVSSGDELAGG